MQNTKKKNETPITHKLHCCKHTEVGKGTNQQHEKKNVQNI